MFILGIGICYMLNGQFQEAKDVLQQVINYSEQFGVESLGTMSKMYLGAVSMAEGHMEQGLKIIEEAQRSLLENGEKVAYMMSDLLLGKIYLQMVEKAAPAKLATVMKNIGFLAKNVPFAARKAESHYNKAIEVSRKIGARGFMSQAYLDLGLLHKVKGRNDKARECLSEAIQLFEQCEDEVNLRQAQEALASLE